MKALVILSYIIVGVVATYGLGFFAWFIYQIWDWAVFFIFLLGGIIIGSFLIVEEHQKEQ